MFPCSCIALPGRYEWGAFYHGKWKKGKWKKWKQKHKKQPVTLKTMNAKGILFSFFSILMLKTRKSMKTLLLLWWSLAVCLDTELAGCWLKDLSKQGRRIHSNKAWLHFVSWNRLTARDLVIFNTTPLQLKAV